jgi:AcrR family transcriptional regulator
MVAIRSRQSDRRTRLLDAAEDLFVRWGFDKTSVDDIAKESGVSKGAVYLEFPGKEELLRAVLYRELGRFTADWLARFEADPGEWSFARMFQHHLAAIQDRPLMRALSTRDRQILGGFMRRETELSEAITASREEFFSGLQASGLMRDDIPPRVAAYLLNAIGYGLILADDVVPAPRRVGFGEALEALGRLLDRGLDSGNRASRTRARKLLRSMVEGMRSRFEEGRP